MSAPKLEPYKLHSNGGIYMGVLGDIDPELDPKKEYALFVLPKNLEVSGKTLWSCVEAQRHVNALDNGFKTENMHGYDKVLKAGFKSGNAEAKLFISTIPIVRRLVADKDKGEIKNSLIGFEPFFGSKFLISSSPATAVEEAVCVAYISDHGEGAFDRYRDQGRCRLAFAAKLDHLTP
jgi:hypothetical protein